MLTSLYSSLFLCFFTGASCFSSAFVVSILRTWRLRSRFSDLSLLTASTCIGAQWITACRWSLGLAGILGPLTLQGRGQSSPESGIVCFECLSLTARFRSLIQSASSYCVDAGCSLGLISVVRILHQTLGGPLGLGTRLVLKSPEVKFEFGR